MKSFIVFALFVAAAAALPVTPDGGAQILRYDSDNVGFGGFSYGYETSNGIRAEEQGEVKNAGTENEVLVVRGSYSYLGPDGVTYTVVYTGDENGFVAKGDHIPQ